MSDILERPGFSFDGIDDGIADDFVPMTRRPPWMNSRVPLAWEPFAPPRRSALTPPLSGLAGDETWNKGIEWCYNHVVNQCRAEAIRFAKWVFSGEGDPLRGPVPRKWDAATRRLIVKDLLDTGFLNAHKRSKEGARFQNRGVGIALLSRDPAAPVNLGDGTIAEVDTWMIIARFPKDMDKSPARRTLLVRMQFTGPNYVQVRAWDLAGYTGQGNPVEKYYHNPSKCGDMKFDVLDRDALRDANGLMTVVMAEGVSSTPVRMSDPKRFADLLEKAINEGYFGPSYGKNNRPHPGGGTAAINGSLSFPAGAGPLIVVVRHSLGFSSKADRASALLEITRTGGDYYVKATPLTVVLPTL